MIAAGERVHDATIGARPRAELVGAIAGVALGGAWLAVSAPVIRWIGATLSAEAFRLNLALFIGVSVLLARRVGQGALRRAWARVARGPVLRAGPVAVIVGAALGIVVFERVVDVHLASAVLFGIGTWGLLGVFSAPTAWRAALVPSLLLVAVLPFGEQASTYLGFSARLVTARFVEHALAALGVAAIPANTVLLLESGVAYVDVPCSGVKSLWTGLVFFLAALAVERRRVDLRALAAGLAYAVLLFAANVVRVTIVVLLASAELTALADVLHEPLGLGGFAAASAAALALLRRTAAPRAPAQARADHTTADHPRADPSSADPSSADPSSADPSSADPSSADPSSADPSSADPSSADPSSADHARADHTTADHTSRAHTSADRSAVRASRLGALSLAAALVALAPLAASSTAARPAPPPLSVALPRGFSGTPVPLTDAERGLFARVGESSASKRAFEGRGLRGTLLVVDSTSWRAHHPPELCLASAGVRVDALRDLSCGTGCSLRVASLDGGARTSLYWYQSRTRTTGDLVARIAADVTGDEDRWVLVSILLDAPAHDVARAREIHTLVADEVRAAIAAHEGAL
ncbi:archaeosortase/exosortase family protein [Myxococcota bacterium]|nr:archaeosortase/exosortase family protein [Myxococcota bacterium]